MATSPSLACAGRLDLLSAGAAAAQWSLETEIDWRRGARLPLWTTRDEARTALSQLYHGEVATGRLCRRLIEEIDDPEARACLALQIADETRHAEVYERYLDQLGRIAPIDPALSRALDTAAEAPMGPLGLMVAIHVIAEGEVLRLQDSLARVLPCPLLSAINRRVAVDEARHVAFGRLYLSERLAALPGSARREIAGWTFRLWQESAEATLRAGANRGILGRRFLRHWLDDGWARHAAALRRIGLAETNGGAP